MITETSQLDKKILKTVLTLGQPHNCLNFKANGKKNGEGSNGGGGGGRG